MSLKFKATTSAFPDITEGTVYEIVGIDADGDVYFIDDIGEQNFSMCCPDADLRANGEWVAVA